MVSFVKKSLAMLLVVAMVMASGVTAFAAGSPTEGGEKTKAELGSTVSATKSAVTINTYRKTTKKTITITETALVNGKKVKITTIGANAFKNNKQATKINLGVNVKTVKKDAFKGLSKLAKINFKHAATHDIKFEKGAFNGVSKTAKIYVSKTLKKAQVAKIRTLLKKAGFNGTVVVSKNF